MGNSAVAKVDAVMVEKAMTTRNLEVVSSGQAFVKVKFNPYFKPTVVCGCEMRVLSQTIKRKIKLIAA